MIGLLDLLARPLLRALDPEDAHALVMRALPLAPAWTAPAPDPPALAVEAFGLKFPNPLGVAAGLDKDARVFTPLLRLGFGFAEVGTVTPRPQPGNPRPRLFRLEADEAVINRLGFNNEGFDAVRGRLAGRGDDIVGVNLGANKDTPDRVADYVAGIEAFGALASYCTINVSNTPGLRDLQQKSALDALLARVMEARERVATARRVPVLLKIAPDLALAELDDVVAVARARRVDGMIIANTTVGRPQSLRGRAASEDGGLSGRPLFALSTRMLAETFVRVDRAFPLIGVCGVDSGAAAFAKIKAGATLVQLYTGLVFHGLGLIGEIKRELMQLLRREGFEHIAAAVGTEAVACTAAPWPDR